MTEIQVPQSVQKSRKSKWHPSPWTIDFNAPFDELTLTRIFSKVTMIMYYNVIDVHIKVWNSLDMMLPIHRIEQTSVAMDISDMLGLCHDAMVSVLLYACTPTGTKIRLTENK